MPGKTAIPDQIKRIDYEPVGMISAAPRARAVITAFGVSRSRCVSCVVRPAQSRTRARPAGEKHIDYTAMDIPKAAPHPVLDGDRR